MVDNLKSYMNQDLFHLNGFLTHKWVLEKMLPSHMGLVVRKPVFRVSDKASFKPVSSATETSWKIEISPVASLHMILSIMRITKALIRLRGCAGWSAPVLFAKPRRQVFSRRGPIITPTEIGIKTHLVCFHTHFICVSPRNL